MRSVVAAEYVTLDGVMEDPSWTDPYFDDKLAEYQSAQLSASDALLLGRETFESFAAAWPSMEETEGDFAVRMNTLPKYVASRTLEPPLPWNGTLLEGDVGQAVTTLKQQPGADILVYGSAQLVNTLRTHDLIDRYVLMVFPVMLGAGKRLFDAEDVGLKAFKLANAEKTPTGVAVLTYDLARS